MHKHPFFTILTATLNNRPTLLDTLASVKSQRFKDFEHIVSDGGSQDGSRELLREYEPSYNLTWRSLPDRGIAHALNRGLSIARGEYVLVLHADDRLIDSDVLLDVHECLKHLPEGIGSFPVLKKYPGRGSEPYRPLRILWWHHFKTILPHQGAFVHQNIFQRLGGFREEFRIALDYDFFYRALKKRVPVNFYHRLVAEMGGTGLSSNSAFLEDRLGEEAAVQKLNETNSFWKGAQLLFWFLYRPYKLKMLPGMSGLCRKEARDE